MTTQPLSVAIVGGGIAGLTLAHGLLKSNLYPTIFERDASLREIGAGIGFTPNAERAMKLLDPHIHAAFKRVTVQNGTDWFMWVDGSAENEGSVIHKMYLGERGFEGCARADFLDEVSKDLPANMTKFGKKLERIVDEDGTDGVVLEFADGTRTCADVVIGCDGIRSRIRQHVVGSPNISAGYTHKYAFRGLIPMSTASSVLGKEKTNTRHMYLGPNGHALTFPVAGGKLLNVVAFVTDPDEWPHQNSFTAPAKKADAIKAFKDFGPTVRSIIDMLPDELSKWAVFDTYDNPAPTFVKGRVCISGDAAHAAAPYHGAGAGFAIEDGAVLAWLLSAVNSRLIPDVDTSKKAYLVEKALQTYNHIRLERAHWLVETSRYIGEMYEWQDTRVGSDHVLSAKEIDWRCRKIWDYDVDGMMRQTRELFKSQLSAVPA